MHIFQNTLHKCKSNNLIFNHTEHAIDLLVRSSNSCTSKMDYLILIHFNRKILKVYWENSLNCKKLRMNLYNTFSPSNDLFDITSNIDNYLYIYIAFLVRQQNMLHVEIQHVISCVKLIHFILTTFTQNTILHMTMII